MPVETQAGRRKAKKGNVVSPRRSRKPRKEVIRDLLLVAQRQKTAELYKPISAHGVGGDQVDCSQTEASVNFDLASIKQVKQDLKDIQKALNMLDDDEYGICEDCGDKIPADRLSARPWAIRCVGCQIAWEKQHKIA